MIRKRKYMVDGRLKLSEGDKVKITAPARAGIEKNTGIRVESWELGTVKRIQYDISERRFFATVQLGGQDIWMPISDLIYQGR